ncbi:MAG: type II secretion system inner membrane protein GspF [Salinisphaeraceae bacterium]|nr:type II secretion system inner membrane protein GspF [Salinisphaeraceae bacterium]
MGAFEYVALDQRGRQKRGVLEGDAPRQVRQNLREQGLVPMEVKEVSGRKGQGGSSTRRFGLRQSLSVTELALFTRQLATLVRAGLPLESALQAVSQQTESARTEKVVLGIRSKVLEGHDLASALADFPGVFPEIYRATVAAGEHSGHLDGVLERLADYVENQQVMRQKIQLALFYPVILSIVAIGVTVALLAYVVPKIITVFENIDQELPLLTQGLIATSDFLRDYGLILLILIVLAAVAGKLALRQENIRWRYHRWLLRLPLFGRATRGINTGRFARTFSILVNSGVPVLDSLRICSEVVVNLPMRDAIDNAAKRVREGSSIHQSLAQYNLFPPITLHLIANGESSGELGAMLERAAQHQEREVETLISALMGIFEPVLILTMGGVVLLIVLAILLPIFDLNTLVQ